MSPSRIALLLSVTTALACTKNETVTAEVLPPPRVAPDAGEVAPPPPTTTATATATAKSPPREEPIVIAPREADALPLGAPCSSGPTCGTKGKVAVRAFARREVFVPDAKKPCKPIAMTDMKRIADGYAMSACVAGEQVYAEANCIMCRIQNMTVVEAQVAELTPAQLDFVQKQTGLAGAGRLATIDAWDRAIKDAHSKIKN
jgi:hypothetical protein